MRVKKDELIEYLNESAGDEVVFLCVDPKKRIIYRLNQCFCITDRDNAAICLEVGEETDLDGGIE